MVEVESATAILGYEVRQGRSVPIKVRQRVKNRKPSDPKKDHDAARVINAEDFFDHSCDRPGWYQVGRPTHTPPAWMISPCLCQTFSEYAFGVHNAEPSHCVPNPVLGVGHFKRALPGHSCRAPKPPCRDLTGLFGSAFSPDGLPGAAPHLRAVRLAQRRTASFRRIVDLCSSGDRLPHPNVGRVLITADVPNDAER